MAEGSRASGGEGACKPRGVGFLSGRGGQPGGCLSCPVWEVGHAAGTQPAWQAAGHLILFRALRGARPQPRPQAPAAMASGFLVLSLSLPPPHREGSWPLESAGSFVHHLPRPPGEHLQSAIVRGNCKRS